MPLSAVKIIFDPAISMPDSKRREVLIDIARDYKKAQNNNEAYYEALKKCLNRYRSMVVRDNHFDGLASYNLGIFLTEFETAINDKMPLNKLNRWLGYIQGVLISNGLTTVEIERDWTRPLFSPLDYPQ